MGSFKDDLKSEEKKFGEAIVEIRGISGVQSWFLAQCQLDSDLQGEFLQTPFLDNSWEKVYNKSVGGVDLIDYGEIRSGFNQQALGLFDFLLNFGSNSQQIKEIFYMGIPTGLKWDNS